MKNSKTLNFHRGRSGFTLIELLIVIAIIAILAAVAFVALDPLTRFKDARDSSRWSDVTALLSAIKIDQIDNGGSYLSSISSATSSWDYMISNATTTSGCNATPCDGSASTSSCVNLQGLVDQGYLASLPTSPNGSGTWSSTITGYYLNKNSNGTITVGACESENTSEINVAR